MKTLIISDLHSNIDALEAIWALENDSDLIICAGDLVDIGPYPKEVIHWVQEHQAICVKGNHDVYLVNLFDARAKGDNSIDNNKQENENWLYHNLEQLNEADINFLRNLPETFEIDIDSMSIGITHAYQGYDVIIGAYAFKEFLERRFTRTDITTLIFGHTHRQAICQVSTELSWVNPGSTSYRSYQEPDNRFTGCEYMTLIDGNFEFKRLSYDSSAMHAEIKRLQHSLHHKTVEMALRRFPALPLIPDVN